MSRPSLAEVPPEYEPEDEVEAAEERSLIEDIKLLVTNATALVTTELGFQKARALFAADAAKSIVLFGLVSGVLALLALVGLTVGLIIALTPHLTAWGATAVVVVALLVAAFLLARAAGGRWQKMMAMLSEEGSEP